MSIRFIAGDHGDVGGIRWRVRTGRKGPTDLILDLEGGRGFVPVRMALGFLMADFFEGNEAQLYPRMYGYQAGDMYMNFCLMAQRHGWLPAVAELERQREQREARRRRDPAA